MTLKQQNLDTPQQQLRDFGASYQYDIAYLERVLKVSPDGYAAFGAAQGLGAYRQELSVEAHFVARIAVMLAEDCGGCTQINLRMAAEQGLPRELLGAVLEDSGELPPILREVRAHAMAVTSGVAIDAERAAALRAGLGEQAFIELALTIAGSRIYPGLKRALAEVGSCSKPHLDF